MHCDHMGGEWHTSDFVKPTDNLGLKHDQHADSYPSSNRKLLTKTARAKRKKKRQAVRMARKAQRGRRR